MCDVDGSCFDVSCFVLCADDVIGWGRGAAAKPEYRVRGGGGLETKAMDPLQVTYQYFYCDLLLSYCGLISFEVLLYCC